MIINFDHKSFGSRIRISQPNGYGSTNTMIRKYSVVEVNTAVGFTLTQSATNGDSITLNQKGLYYYHNVDLRITGGSQAGVSINSNQLTTSIQSITAATRLSYAGGLSSQLVEVKGFYLATAGDVLRAHTQNLNVGTSAYQFFEVIRIF